MSAIAGHLATEAPVLVLSGTPGSKSREPVSSGEPTVPDAGQGFVKRANSRSLLTLRTALALLMRLRRGDVVLTVTAPFLLPYAAAAAARLRRARSILIMHDLYPDVLVMAGMLYDSVVGSMELDISKALSTGWRPPIDLDEGLRLAIHIPT